MCETLRWANGPWANGILGERTFYLVVVPLGVPLVELSWPAVDLSNDIPEVDTCVVVPVVKLGWPVVDLNNDVPVVDFDVVFTEGGWEEAVVIKLGSILLLHKSP